MKVKVVSTPFPELLNRWEKVKGKVTNQAVKCEDKTCSTAKIMGCLVEIVGCDKGGYYVVPIYETCAKPVSTYEVDENILVRYDKDQA